jgi:hypothetical protein
MKAALFLLAIVLHSIVILNQPGQAASPSGARAHEFFSQPADPIRLGISVPNGIYVVNEAAGERPASEAYATGLTSSPAYSSAVAGHAVFVPIAKILPSITTWGQFAWSWGYLDSLVQVATSHGKQISLELETGYQQSGATYLRSLPQGFLALAGDSSAPLFNVWTIGGTSGRGISAYVLLPWNPKVQEFWQAAALAIAAHLKSTGAYGSLTMVHVPGLSVYDEELRLPTGMPAPPSTDTSHCPDGRPAYPSTITDGDTARWRGLGYSDSIVVNGFGVITKAFADAFPDKYLCLSLLPIGSKGADFPNLSRDTVGQVAWQLVKAANAIAPGRIQLQADNLEPPLAETQVLSCAAAFGDPYGWQSNKHGSTGAGCNGGGIGSCGPDGPTSPYFELLKYGSTIGGRYVEVWSAEVVEYPVSILSAYAAGYYPLTAVEDGESPIPLAFDLSQNYPNPLNPSTVIRYALPVAAQVLLSVYDVLGREVQTIVNEKKQPGRYEVTFNASNLASGVYFYRFQAGSFVQTKKLLLLH